MTAKDISVQHISPSPADSVPVVLALDDPLATDVALTGGKGSSLARLIRAGFSVPHGCVVTTAAYTDFVAINGLEPRINRALEAIDYTNAEDVERTAEEIRAIIVSAPIPDALLDEVLASYRLLGADPFVAVRSSGTAEDLAEASFAGQHDSYLDIRGDGDVLDAVRRCWASMWTARAIAYRDQNHFDHADVSIAVVVQVMIASDVSGVMFTANPITAAVDEIVINASWGLGEGIVSGVVTPDQFTLDSKTLSITSRHLGTKLVQVSRNETERSGVEHRPVSTAEQRQYCLDDAELASLGDLGRRVAHYYGDWPQDVEWALHDGSFYVLQSRDVTGVEFSWDEDLEDYVDLAPLPDDAVLSRAFSDEAWTGTITPLFYSVRGEVMTKLSNASAKVLGVESISEMRVFKYHRGEVYFNSQIQYLPHVQLLPRALRNPMLLGWIPPSWHQKVASEPESYLGYVKALARVRMLDPRSGVYRWFGDAYEQMQNDAQKALGLEPTVIGRMSDSELKQYVNETISCQKEWVEDLWTGFFTHVPAVTSAFVWMLSHWYTGTNANVFADLITGLPKPTITLRENLAMWQLAEKIRASDTLVRLFEENEDEAFLKACERVPEGFEFLADYRVFLAEFGHRGHADRDIWYARRIEDPSIDYRIFSVFLASGGQPPGSGEHHLIARREAATDDVLESIRSRPFGSLKAELFTLVHSYLLRFFVLRDDERHHTDRLTFAKKRALQEVGQRLVQRDVLVGDDDFYFLSKNELFQLLDGRLGNPRLTKAKIAGRRKNCDRYRKEWSPPMFIRGNGTVYADSETTLDAAPQDGVLRGVGTSRGTVVGTARIVPDQQQLNRVQRGDILVTFSTDPGWTTIFLVLSGLVLESGGLLAHGSCISREYGIPAVQITDAMTLIEDGSTISIDGDTGEVRILARPGEPVPVPAETVDRSSA